MTREQIAATINAVRKERGLTIRQVAEKSGRDTRAVQAVIHGKYSYGIDTLLDVAKVLGVELDLRLDDIAHLC